MNETEAALLFAVLSNADRLKVIRALVEAGPEGLKAGDIAVKINASPSRASFHLTALNQSGFVGSKRKSRSILYQINFNRLGALVSFLMEDCCKGSRELRDCCNMQASDRN